MTDQKTVLGVNVGEDDNSSSMSGDSNQFDSDAFIAENVGDGKKYATAEEALRELAKGKFHADLHINTLELEMKGEKKAKAELESKLVDSKKIDDLLNALTDEDSTVQPAAQAADGSAQIDLDQVKTIVRDLLVAEKDAENSVVLEQTKSSNRDAAFDLLAKPVSEGGFGSMENAKLAIREYVGQDSEKADIIDRMGSHTPEAVAEFLKIQLKGNDKLDGVGVSGINISENNKVTNGMLTWAKAKQVKKDDPALYKSPKFQMQIHEAAANNPDFWD
jgi:hypothetical protein